MMNYYKFVKLIIRLYIIIFLNFCIEAFSSAQTLTTESIPEQTTTATSADFPFFRINIFKVSVVTPKISPDVLIALP